jgi:MFS family permease
MFWTGAFLSNIGTWMETVALGYYVADVTRQAAWNGVIAAASFVPIAFLAPLGGVLADRRSRKALLIVTTLVQAALAALIAVLIAVEAAPPGVVALVVLAGGCAGALGFPAYQAIIPELVPADDLVAAVGLGSAQYNLGRIIGPALAGVAITLGGVPTALVINALSFFAVVVVLVLITVPPPQGHSASTSIHRAIVDAIAYVRREPGLRVSMLTLCVVTFLAAPFIALIPAMAVTVLDGDDVTTAILVTAQGVGAVVASVSLGALAARFGVGRVLVGAVTGLPLALLVYAWAPTLAPMALALTVVGAFYVTELTSVSTIAQLRSPDRLRGRVLSLNMMILGLLYPIGALLQGRVADVVGLRATTAGAALLLLAIVVVVRLVHPRIAAPIDEPAHDLEAAPA